MLPLLRPALLVTLLLGAPLGALAEPADASAVDVDALLTELDAAMESDDPAVRRGAVEALAAARARDVARALVRHLDDPDPRVRAAVARTIGAQGDERAAANLIRLLRVEEEAAVRIAICDGLARVPHPRWIEPLEDVAMDAFNVREDALAADAAIRALGAIRERAAIEALMGLVRRSDPGYSSDGSGLTSSTRRYLERRQPALFTALEELTGLAYPTPKVWVRWWEENERTFDPKSELTPLAEMDRFKDDGYRFRMRRPNEGWTWKRSEDDDVVLTLVRPSEGRSPRPAARIVVAAYDVTERTLKTPEERVLHWNAWADRELRDVKDRESREIRFGGESDVVAWSARGRHHGREVVERRLIVRRGEVMFEIRVRVGASAPDGVQDDVERVLRSVSFF